MPMPPGIRSSAACAVIVRAAGAVTNAGALAAAAAVTAGLAASGAAFAARVPATSPAALAAPRSDCGGSDSLLGSLTGILCPVTNNATSAVASLVGGNGATAAAGGPDQRGG